MFSIIVLITADLTIPVANPGDLIRDDAVPLEFAYTANGTSKRSSTGQGNFSGFRHDLLADMGASSHILDLPDRFFIKYICFICIAK